MWLSDQESTCNAGDVGLIPGSGRSPEEGMATHSSILAWRIPWTKEPDRLQSMGSQRFSWLRDFYLLTLLYLISPPPPSAFAHSPPNFVSCLQVILTEQPPLKALSKLIYAPNHLPIFFKFGTCHLRDLLALRYGHMPKFWPSESEWKW